MASPAGDLWTACAGCWPSASRMIRRLSPPGNNSETANWRVPGRHDGHAARSASLLAAAGRPGGVGSVRLSSPCEETMSRGPGNGRLLWRFDVMRTLHALSRKKQFAIGRLTSHYISYAVHMTQIPPPNRTLKGRRGPDCPLMSCAVTEGTLACHVSCVVLSPPPPEQSTCRIDNHARRLPSGACSGEQ